MSSFQAQWSRIEALDAHVLGVSVDSTATKGAWEKSLGGLSFDLLSDFYPHGAVAEAYGMLRPEGFASRSIFIVDKAGRIAWMKEYPLPEVPEIREVIDALQSVPR